MPGAAFYNGLNASPDYAARRRDSMENITIATRMRDDALDQMKERMKAMGLVSAQLEETAQKASEMLPADAKRFKAAHEKLMQPVIAELSKYNNDTHMLQLMAPEVVSKYKRGLLESPELRDAREHKKNFELGVAATQKGQWVAPVEVEYPEGTKETVPWHEALDMFNKNIIKDLPFKAAYDIPEINPTEFLHFEMPASEAKGKGSVSTGMLGNYIHAKSPNIPLDEANKMAKIFEDTEKPGYSKLLWGNVLSHGSGSGYGSWLTQQKYMDKLQSVKSVTDNLHRAMFDPTNKTTYDPVTGAYNVNVTPFDITKLRKGTGKFVNEAIGVQVKNDAADPSKSRFVVKYDDGTSDELTFDDMAQRILGASNVNIGDYTSLMGYINNDGTNIYNPNKYAAATPEIGFGATTAEQDQSQYMTPDIQTAFEIATSGKTPQRYKRKDSYYTPASGGKINIEGWSNPQ